MARQVTAFSRAYRSQTSKSCALVRKAFIRDFPNLIRVQIRPGALVFARGYAAFW
jgi:hypothetical protein